MASAKRTRQRQLRTTIQEGVATLAEVRSEIVDLGEAVAGTGGTIEVLLISPGWGSSGFYSPDVLEAAGTARVFPRGTQMFLDHPTMTERNDRPERSVRDLAAVLESDGVWNANGKNGPGLYAFAKVFETWKPLIAELAAHIGVSIRAAAEMSSGEAEGRKGRIIDRLVEAVSVDFVTRAGRGGAVLAVLEAAGHQVDEARNIGEWMQSRIHLDFTTRADDMFGEGRLTKDERISLSNAIGAALDAFATTVEDLAPQLLARDLWADPAATQTTTESQEDQMDKKEIDEAVAAAVQAQVAPIVTELEETKAKLAAAETELAEAKTTGQQASEALLLTAAKGHVEANDKVKALPEVAKARVVEALVHAATAGDDGKLDTAKLDEAITTTVDAEVKYLAEATGSPVRGVGSTSDGTPAGSDDATKDAEARLEESFKAIGLTDGAAKIAVGGRA